MSQNSIAATRNMSKSSVREVCKIADERKIRYVDVKELSEDEVYQMFFPGKYTDLNQLYELLAYDQVHSELKKVSVMLKLLWREYRRLISKPKRQVGFSHPGRPQKDQVADLFHPFEFLQLANILYR